jgi:predicted glutamine amidotransferase
MCRLLGVVSAQTRTLTDLLPDDLEPFAALSAEHCDGWGIASWDQHDNLDVVVEPLSALAEPGLIDRSRRVTTDCALLHLRKASAGLAVKPENTHPFTAGSVAFAHNGYFSPVDALDGVLRDAEARSPRGDTDSERYFLLVAALMRESGPVGALVRAMTLIAEHAEVVSLNALLLTNQALYAVAYWDEDLVTSQGGDPSSYELRFRVDPGEVVVASSGWEQPSPSWEMLGSGTVLEVRRHDLCVSVHRPALR